MSPSRPHSDHGYPELWGGAECTVNRVGSRYYNQLARTEHWGRLADIDRFADLGIHAIRFPIIWELLEPRPKARIDWSWIDAALNRLREHHVRPIVGLMHHGSGPSWTSLLDPMYPHYFANFARRVAERYPWVDAYIPVNEPLTTARFSGLYGHWYPHQHDDSSFVQMLLQQCRATRHAMDVIRAANPDALFIQTEDLGRAYGTALLQYQCDFENTRRWLTWDLLHGRIDRAHPMWNYLLAANATAEELFSFAEHPCPPDILGINHYLTSERYLDERVEEHPSVQAGGNGRHTYVDIAAIHVADCQPSGLLGVLREAWDRYHQPLAVTECHLGCTREEQMRWFWGAWQMVLQARAEDVDVRALTNWALLGCWDWDSLVTQDAGHYEVGAFDVRASQPRPTAVAQMVSSLAKKGDFHHPILTNTGWWHKHRSTVSDNSEMRENCVLIAGSRGTLGHALGRACHIRGIQAVATTRADFDIADPDSIDRMIARYRPWAIINAAGYVDVDRAETDVVRCARENIAGPECLAVACAQHGIQLVTFSTDLVFNGRSSQPYIETDRTCPVNVYGETKATAEVRVLKVLPSALVIRASTFFGPWDEANLITSSLRTLCTGDVVTMPGDLVMTPSYVPDLANATLDLLLDREHGIWHLTHDKALTWAEFVTEVARRAGVSTDGLQSQSWSTLNFIASRPTMTALRSERGWILPSLDSAVDRYLDAVSILPLNEVGMVPAG